MTDLLTRALTVAGLSLLLGCGGEGPHGQVEIATAFAPGDNCPSITWSAAAPVVTSVGGSVAVTATATDPDPGDRLSYAWSPPAAFQAPTAPATAFTCAAAGRQTLTVTVSDDHRPTPCATSATLVVECLAAVR
ncbi:MAG TPA: hypothetical protein VHO06_21500 [Polyangia bacterium]|nr:hypothetical protein [Polyangia bacterium]